MAFSAIERMSSLGFGRKEVSEDVSGSLRSTGLVE